MTRNDLQNSLSPTIRWVSALEIHYTNHWQSINQSIKLDISRHKPNKEMCLLFCFCFSFFSDCTALSSWMCCTSTRDFMSFCFFVFWMFSFPFVFVEISVLLGSIHRRMAAWIYIHHTRSRLSHLNIYTVVHFTVQVVPRGCFIWTIILFYLIFSSFVRVQFALANGLVLALPLTISYINIYINKCMYE